MLCLRLVILTLVLIIRRPYAQGADGNNCTRSCTNKLPREAQSYCLQACEELVKENTTQAGPGNKVPSAPGTPMLVSSKFKSVRLTWNSTRTMQNLTAEWYILEICPKWPSAAAKQRRNKTTSFTSYNVVIHPYLEKYRITKEEVYTVKQLLAKMNYTFRVAVVTLNGLSSFSEWSDLIHTNYTCETTPCSITNIRLVLTLQKPFYDKASLNGTLLWNPTTDLTIIPENWFDSAIFKITTPQSGERKCTKRFSKGYKETGSVERLTFKNQSFHVVKKPSQNDDMYKLYFGCDYNVKIWYGDSWKADEEGNAHGSWIFKIPNCFSSDSSPTVCGCKYVNNILAKDISIHVQLKPSMLENSNVQYSNVTVTWRDNSWNNTNILFFVVILDRNYDLPNYVDNNGENVHEYSTTFQSLKHGTDHTIRVYARALHGCLQEKYEWLPFRVTYPCSSNPCPPNATCHRNGYMGKHTCKCDSGLQEINKTCHDIDECLVPNSCSKNATCLNNPAPYSCQCQSGFTGNGTHCKDIDECRVPTSCPKNATCLNKPASYSCQCQSGFTGNETYCQDIDECVGSNSCDKKARCLNNLGSYSCQCKSGFTGNGTYCQDLGDGNDVTIVVASTVPAAVILAIIIIVAIKVFRSRKMQRRNHPVDNFELGTPVPLRQPNREVNMLYTLHNEIQRMSLCDGLLIELTNDDIQLNRIIGRGAFADVYLGKACGVCNNPGWTVVAVKQLAG